MSQFAVSSSKHIMFTGVADNFSYCCFLAIHTNNMLFVLVLHFLTLLCTSCEFSSSGHKFNTNCVPCLYWPSSTREHKMKSLRVYGLFGGKKDKGENTNDASSKVGVLFLCLLMFILYVVRVLGLVRENTTKIVYHWEICWLYNGIKNDHETVKKFVCCTSTSKERWFGRFSKRLSFSIFFIGYPSSIV